MEKLTTFKIDPKRFEILKENVSFKIDFYQINKRIYNIIYFI